MKRNHFLDFLRGFALVNMLVYHFFYDLVHIFNYEYVWFLGDIGAFWQQGILQAFVLVSGFTSNLQKKPIKGGLKLFFWGLAITLVTMMFFPQETIIWGVLSFLGIASILTHYAKRFLDKANWKRGFITCLILFVLTKHLSMGILSFGALTIKKVPEVLGNIDVLFPIGFPNERIFSADYVPILPWIFLYWMGRFLGQKVTFPKIVGEKNALSFLGRHSLLVYLVHQPVIYFSLTLFL